MSELISRQKLIEELENLDKYFVEALPLNSETVFIAGEVRELIESQPPAECVPLSEVYRVIAGHSDYHGDNILAALTCIAEGKEVKPVRPLPADRWIPCSERLPELLKEVLVVVKDGSRVWVDIAECFEGYDGKLVWTGLYGVELVAWMPLPEPYKGVE